MKKIIMIFLGLTIALVSFSQKIISLPSATGTCTGCLFPVTQSGVTKKYSIDSLSAHNGNFANTNLTATGNRVHDFGTHDLLIQNLDPYNGDVIRTGTGSNYGSLNITNQSNMSLICDNGTTKGQVICGAGGATLKASYSGAPGTGRYFSVSADTTSSSTGFLMFGKTPKTFAQNSDSVLVRNGSAGILQNQIKVVALKDLYLGALNAGTMGQNWLGLATLSSGTVTVSTTQITSGSVVELTYQNCSSCGTIYKGTISAGTSFVINSTNGSDGSIVLWHILY